MKSQGGDLMNSQGLVSTNLNCGFFDLYLTDKFLMKNPGDNLSRILGLNPADSAEGMDYIDMVCPEDREQVAEALRAVYDEGKQCKEVIRPGRCIRHRLILPDDNVVTVSLTFGYDQKGYLICSVMRLYDDIGGENQANYRSNSVLESFAISMAVVFINKDGHIVVKYANNDFYRMIGWNRLEFNDYFNECLGEEIIHPDDFGEFRNALISMGEERSEAVFETRVRNMNGSITFTEVRARFLERENENALITLTFADITQRKILRKELIIKNERFNIIQQSSEQTIFDYDTEKDACILTGNIGRIEKYLSVYNYNRHTGEIEIKDFFNGQFPLNIMSKEDYRAVCDSFADSIVSGVGNEIDFQAYPVGQSSGTWFRCTYSAVKDEWGNVIRIVGKLKNIDKQKKAEQLNERRLKTDMLTGLLNKETAKTQIREFLDSQKESQKSNDKFHALIIIDLDNFHLINDYFGHTFGDNVLKEFASDIKSSFRDTDIVSRLVGDRFMILMKDVTQKFAVKKAGRLCRSMVKHFGAQYSIVISCSIGVAFFGKDTSDFSDLYQYADRAVYEAKKNGKNAYCIYDSELQSDYSRLANEITQSSVADSIQTGSEIPEIDANLMDIAFSLLSASDDIYGTLEILLRTVGRKYNLSFVSLYIKGYNKGEKLKKVSRWISNRNLPTRGGRSPLVVHHVDLDAELGRAGMRCISDVTTSNLNPVLKNLLKNDGISSLVICRLEGRSGETFGYVVYTQLEHKRKWSRKEINTFRYFAKILSVVLAEKYAERSLIAKGIEDLSPETNG